MKLEAPADHEIEISIFGRGYGESVLVHLGSGKWFLTDSLLNADGNPAALVYLSAIGANADEALVHVLATHWHDDHVAGLSTIYEQCPNARVWFPLALGRDEWRAFRQSVSGCGSERFTSGVRELEKIARLRKDLIRDPFKFAKAGQLLLKDDGRSFAHAMPIEVQLLSPSDRDVDVFISDLARAHVPEPVARVSPFKRNNVSVAAWLSVGAHNVAFGADLEVTGDQGTGWEAVFQSPSAPQGTASLFKVAHHGSENGHYDPLWTTHLSVSPHAMLAPFNRNPCLPRKADVDRILSLTPNAFVTGQLGRRPKRRDSAVERTLRETGREPVAIPNVGQVRARLDPRDSMATWEVTLFGGACPLDQLRIAS